MTSQTLAIHERIGTWGRHLRPRLAGTRARIVETRSAEDLVGALARTVHPIVLCDLARRHAAALVEVDAALRVAPDALVLVLDPYPLAGAALLARELGATHVISGPAPPPRVEGLLLRWLSLAERRVERAGWVGSCPNPPEREPWSWLTPFLEAHASA
ncbi:MAG: hypothetical protein NVSMB9_07460 [Isosphaeraceae bacterium]